MSGTRTAPVTAGIAVTVAVVAAVLPLTTVYAPGPLPVLLGGAAVAAALVTAGLRAARLSATAALCVGLLALGAALVVLGTWLPRPSGSLLGATVAAVRHSGAHILTTAVPIPTSLDTVALPVSATWLAAAAGIIGLAYRRPAVAALPPVVLFAATVTLVGPVRSAAYGYTAALVAALVVLLGTMNQHRTGRSAAIGVIAVAVLLVGTTVALGPGLFDRTERQPPDPRTHVVPPYQNPEQLNPLSRLGGWAADANQPLLQVHTNRPTRLRWVTLSDFNGVTWLPAETYRAVGALLPAAEDAPPTTVRGEVSVVGLTGGWLPVPDGASEVRGVRVAIDPESATLAAPDGLRPDLRYTVAAAPVEWSPERLAEARLPSDPAFDRYRTLPPGAPARLNEIARTAVGGTGGSPYEQATRLVAYLREHYRFDPKAPGGNGYPSLNRFLTGSVEAGGARGTSEQFATAFTMLARALSIPARVVVGFAPGQQVGDGEYLIRTQDALAWSEIYLDGLGWVAIDPTPPLTNAPLRPDAGDKVQPAPTTTPDTTPEKNDNDTDDEPAEAAEILPPRSPGEAGQIGPLGISLGTAVVLLVVAVAAVPVLRLRRRSVRLDRGDPTTRILGAWAELRDGLRLAGHGPAGALVVAEVCELATATVGEQWREQSDQVTRAVNAVGFGGAPLGELEAARTAGAVRDLVRELLRQSGWIRRLTWWLDPRPLWWRR